MLINDILNKDELYSLIVTELRDYGIKFNKERKRKNRQEKYTRRRIFNVPLHQLELTDVVLVNGGIVQIPAFIFDACQKILENIDTEGLFRKAGSAKRQRDIMTSLEAGKQLGKSHHVIDIANILKTFFRDIPEALLPAGNVQESILRCLLCDDKLYALSITCLLLPPLTLNTLAFFMQFLHKVLMHSDCNKMSLQNLAIIFAPSLMPLKEVLGNRLNNHIKVIEMLIENSHNIGVVPENFLKLCQQNKLNKSTTVENNKEKEDKKRKKRRSGSLTRVFNGLKKIVGVRGSAEQLDITPNTSLTPIAATPCLTKSNKKRKATEFSGFSTKKMKNVLDMLPQKGSLLPCTPIVVKEGKKFRMSFGGSSRNIEKFQNAQKIVDTPAEIPVMERRWSVVGTPINRNKKSEGIDRDSLKYLSPVVSLPCLNLNNDNQLNIGNLKLNSSLSQDIKDMKILVDEDYVRIPKKEYQAINDRVTAIETRISQEFDNAKSSLLDATNHMINLEKQIDKNDGNNLEFVQNIYKQTLQDTASFHKSSTEELAKRLSRDLKIRKSVEHKIIRSPSARKIGTLRRRSQENSIKLARNKSWHIPNNKEMLETSAIVVAPQLSFYPSKANLKRGRPNTVQSGLRHPSPNPTTDRQTINYDSENWKNAHDYFDKSKSRIDSNGKISIITEKCKEIPNVVSPQNLHISERRQSLRSASKTYSHRSDNKSPSPRYVTKISTTVSANSSTPMLPPKGIPPSSQKTPFYSKQRKTPVFDQRNIRMALFNNSILTPLGQDEQTGRPSIAKLRTQNAGMVLAKAKLFDDLSQESIDDSTKISLNDETASRKNSICETRSHSLEKNKNEMYSPRGAIQRRQRIRSLISQKSINCSPKTMDHIANGNLVIENKMQNVPYSSFLKKVKASHSTQQATFSVPSLVSMKIIDETISSSVKKPKIKQTLLINSPRRLIKTPAKEGAGSFTALKVTRANSRSPKIVLRGFRSPRN